MPVRPPARSYTHPQNKSPTCPPNGVPTRAHAHSHSLSPSLPPSRSRSRSVSLCVALSPSLSCFSLLFYVLFESRQPSRSRLLCGQILYQPFPTQLRLNSAICSLQTSTELHSKSLHISSHPTSCALRWGMRKTRTRNAALTATRVPCPVLRQTLSLMRGSGLRFEVCSFTP